MLTALPRTLRSFAALRAGIPAVRRAFAENERSDRRALEALQIERLKMLLVNASEHSPFWRRRLVRFAIHPETVRSIRDLAALPPLEARDLADFGDELLSHGRPDPTWRPAHPLDRGGRGAPLWLDGRARRERLADEIRHLGWLGLDWRSPRAALAGRAETGEPLPEGGGRLRGALRGGVWLHPARAATEGREFLERAARSGAELLAGPPGALSRLAAAAPAQARALHPRAVQASGECLGDERRARLEQAFGAPVYDAYRSREAGEAAHECTERDGLHVSMERVLVEVVRDGEPVADGEDGELLLTVLDNQALPLLRWRTGDLAVRVPGPPCRCGRTSERILVQDGRASELVTSPAGRRIHGDWFEWLFEVVPGVAGWRVVQDRPESLVLEIVRDEGWREDAAAGLAETLAGIDPAFHTEVRFVESLPARPDGRRYGVHSRVPPAWANDGVPA